MNKRLVLFFIILLPDFVVAQNSDSLTVQKISAEIMLNSGAYRNLEKICREIGPRLSGSANADKAVIAATIMLREAGADTVYLQPCMVPHWVRGKKETGQVNLGAGVTRKLNLCALGSSVGTGKKGVSGPVAEVTSFDELHRLGRQGIAGKIVFFNFKMDPALIETFKAYGQSGIARRIGPAQAARYGAVAVMVRSLATNIDDYPHTGNTSYNDSFPKIPAVAISTADAEWLSERLRSGESAVASFKTYCTTLADKPSFNVIGELRGAEKPEEIITVGGHLDSWDMGEGAHDDGAGCVQSIEVIRSLNALKMKPKRTIRAVLFMNEENGSRGAKAYLEAARNSGDKYIFALESDAGGFAPRGFGLDMPEDQYLRILRWRSIFEKLKVYDFFRGGGGADIGPLKKIGTALAGLSPDSQRYFDIHHAASDTFDKVNKRELDLGAAAMTALVWLVSEYGL